MSDTPILEPRPVLKPWIASIHAYVPGKSKAEDGRELVKLSANENPLGCSQAALDALAQGHHPNLYPDPDATRLREAIRAPGSGEAFQEDDLQRLIFSSVRDESVCRKYRHMPTSTALTMMRTASSSMIRAATSINGIMVCSRLLNMGRLKLSDWVRRCDGL